MAPLDAALLENYIVLPPPADNVTKKSSTRPRAYSCSLLATTSKLFPDNI
jgi:hypothetical protein